MSRNHAPMAVGRGVACLGRGLGLARTIEMVESRYFEYYQVETRNEPKPPTTEGPRQVPTPIDDSSPGPRPGLRSLRKASLRGVTFTDHRETPCHRHLTS